MNKRSSDDQQNFSEISKLGKFVAEYRGSINNIVWGIVSILVGIYAAVALFSGQIQDTGETLFAFALMIGLPIFGVYKMREFKTRIVVYSEGFAVITTKETRAIRWEDIEKVQVTSTHYAGKQTPTPEFFIKLNNGDTIPISDSLVNYIQLGSHIQQEIAYRNVTKAALEVAQKPAVYMRAVQELLGHTSTTSTSPKTTPVPHLSEEQGKPTIDAKIALRAYWRNQAENWWEHNPDRGRDAVCDVCNSSITPTDSFYFVEGRRMKCESCTERSLKDWEESGKPMDFFGLEELLNALKHYKRATEE